MKRFIELSLIASALALLATPSSAEMKMPKATGQQTAGGMQGMMSECSAMMQETMADPVVRTRMMAIMQKHMRGHVGHGAMMMPGMSGANATQAGTARSGSSPHEAHHTTTGPVAAPASSGSPLSSPSP